VSADEWGTFVTGVSGWVLVITTVMLLVMRNRRSVGYVAAAAYVVLVPIHLWFWQFELVSPQGLPRWYFWSAVIQIVVGILNLIWFSFVRFRPVIAALILMYLFSLILQLFSYMYWSYGTIKDFSVTLSHLDSFYFALGTLTTAGTGNVSAISETARRLQTLQMGIDFILVGFVVFLILTRYSTLFDRRQPSLSQDDVLTIVGRILQATNPTAEPGSLRPEGRAPSRLGWPPLNGNSASSAESSQDGTRYGR